MRLNVKSVFTRATSWIASRVHLANGNGWKWVGDDVHPTLFEKRFEHGEFSVVARLGIDLETSRTERFSDVYVPGAVLLPTRWKNRVDSDIQWYISRRKIQFGVQTGGAVTELVKSVKRLYEHIEADIRIMAGERPLYLIQVEVYYRNECLEMKTELGLAISVDENFVEADEIMESLLLDAVTTVRKAWMYRAMVFSTA